MNGVALSHLINSYVRAEKKSKPSFSGYIIQNECKLFLFIEPIILKHFRKTHFKPFFPEYRFHLKTGPR